MNQSAMQMHPSIEQTIHVGVSEVVLLVVSGLLVLDRITLRTHSWCY